MRKPASVRTRGRRDPRRVRPGVLLGHRVGVLRLAAQARAAASGRSARACRGRARCRRSGCATRGRSSSGRSAPRRAPTRRGSSPGRRARPRAGRRSGARRARRRRIASTSAGGSTPPARSAISSRGISTSSTNRRARSCSSVWAGVNVARARRLDQRHGVPPTASSARRAVLARAGRRRAARGAGRPGCARRRCTIAGGVRDRRVVAAGARRGEVGRLAQPREVRRLAAAQDERLGARGLARGVAGEPSAARARTAARRSPPGARAPAPG